jgi:hypothetical protein
LNRLLLAPCGLNRLLLAACLTPACVVQELELTPARVDQGLELTPACVVQELELTPACVVQKLELTPVGLVDGLFARSPSCGRVISCRGVSGLALASAVRVISCRLCHPGFPPTFEHLMYRGFSLHLLVAVRPAKPASAPVRGAGYEPVRADRAVPTPRAEPMQRRE